MPDPHDPRHSAPLLDAGRADRLLSAPGLESRELVGKQPGAGLFDLASTQDGSHACIFCGVCAKKCPVSCISVRRDSKSKGEGRRSQYLGSIVVDEPRCIACGRCVESCALNALVPTAGYEEHRRRWHAATQVESHLASGHGTCSGCAAPVVVRQVLSAVHGHHVVSGATGCLEVTTTGYPYTAWKGSYIHTAFENAAATLSGVETAYRALRKRGRLSDHVKFIAFGGDGGTYDIGLQSLSGAMERGHDDALRLLRQRRLHEHRRPAVERYAGQRLDLDESGRRGSDGKMQMSKNLTEIMVAHRIPYVAQASPHDPRDLMRKVAKALSVDGPSFLNVLSPCPRGWRTENDGGHRPSPGSPPRPATGRSSRSRVAGIASTTGRTRAAHRGLAREAGALRASRAARGGAHRGRAAAAGSTKSGTCCCANVTRSPKTSGRRRRTAAAPAMRWRRVPSITPPWASRSRHR